MDRERFVIVRPHPALNGDREGEHPARSLPAGEYEGMLTPLLSTDMPASSTITQELLGWKPAHPGLIEDIEQGHYF